MVDLNLIIEINALHLNSLENSTEDRNCHILWKNSKIYATYKKTQFKYKDINKLNVKG